MFSLEKSFSESEVIFLDYRVIWILIVDFGFYNEMVFIWFVDSVFDLINDFGLVGLKFINLDEEFVIFFVEWRD